jgi:hypothetical protein
LVGVDCAGGEESDDEEEGATLDGAHVAAQGMASLKFVSVYSAAHLGGRKNHAA